MFPDDSEAGDLLSVAGEFDIAISLQDSIIFGSNIYSWNRFGDGISDVDWPTKGDVPDSIIFVPQQDIRVVGFSTFTAKDT